MATDKRTRLTIPTGILQPTAPPEPELAEKGQGGDRDPDGPPDRDGSEAPDEATSPEPRSPRVRKKKTPVTASSKLEGRRIYLSEGVHFRLRMLAYQRKQKLSEVAEDV